MRTRRTLHPHGFTLVEMLAVLAITAVLASLTLPAFLNAMRSSNLTTGGNRLIDQLNLARQTAMAKNCHVEFRFYELPDPAVPASSTPAVYRAFQALALDNNGAQTNAITQVTFLPDGISLVNNVTVSSLLPATPSNPPYFVSGAASGNPLGTMAASAYAYMAFHFKPDGSTDLNPNSGPPWFISLANQHELNQAGSSLPRNFFTVQVDAQSGQVRSFRPN